MVRDKTAGQELRLHHIHIIMLSFVLVSLPNKPEKHFLLAIRSLDSYTGHFLRDTMHGLGDYRWRYCGPDGAFVTYEGSFYANRMHGYGTMSYPNGKVFTGIYHSNMRWGPGVESMACLNENVGVWRGTQLVRLAWRPSAPSVAVDLASTYIGRSCVEPHRVLLTPSIKAIGETNSALELLKQCGSEPMKAAEKWNELYSKYSNDVESQLCHVDVFNHDYYKGQVPVLEEVTIDSPKETPPSDDQAKLDYPETETYYAWNNNQMMIHMMKHCFTHESQRDQSLFDITSVLSGPRKRFKPAAQHELDCRTLLMASYLGHVANVAQLINESDVHPDVADMQGNSALIYAACGDQTDIIHFLVEAGANIDSYNDSCCTPLGVALLKFACTEIDIAASGMIQALMPPPTVPPAPPMEEKAIEWNLLRFVSPPSPTSTVNRTPSKIMKAAATKKDKSSMSLKDAPGIKKKSELPGLKGDVYDNESVESFSDDKRLYHNINVAYALKVHDLFQIPSAISPIPYIFEVNDMVREIDATEEDQKKVAEKAPKKIISKVIKDTMKPSKEMMWQSTDKDDFTSIDSSEKLKNDMLARNMLTILQLLSDGADPRLVRCPQPALFIATVSGNADLIRHLVSYGANVNEMYPQTLNYTALDVAVSRPLTYQNLELIRALLECGADATHRLQYDDLELKDPLILEIPGPTLLHAVLAKKTEIDSQEEIRHQVIELLLDYNCSPTLQFRGRSALEVVMTKRIDLLDTFIKCPRTDLNAVINSNNQTLLVKMFSVPFCNSIPASERLQALTNVLLFGADPLASCQNCDETFQNLFVYAQRVLSTMESPSTKQSSGAGKPDPKAKKVEKPKKDDKLSMKSLGKLGTDDVGDYKQAIDLVTECARLLHIRWLQAKLVIELLKVIERYKHRQWNMIIKEHKNKKCTGIWVTATRCLEVWDILKSTKKKLYKDNRVLKQLLYIVHFYNTRPMTKFKQPYMTARDKSMIESDVNYILYEHKMATKLNPEVPLKRPYVTPELYVKADEKFYVCFECAMPFEEDKIVCPVCELVSFCSDDCIMINIERTNCHPCKNYLKQKYFAYPENSGSSV
ncbi:ankyrin repeat and MYND domain-containing protein 1 isoform X2 [Manduca sexta]|uniref:ankyrin repeat and MYND domain-containing protein 1 isoform X2 n=1 Tax=Manduca sexta TaxID=7130 RepID=UPI00188F1E29|nr:ankyrin repeat and MYND domain-containing protein 1 isoform X2 [Manduca sexta]